MYQCSILLGRYTDNYLFSGSRWTKMRTLFVFNLTNHPYSPQKTGLTFVLVNCLGLFFTNLMLELRTQFPA